MTLILDTNAFVALMKGVPSAVRHLERTTPGDVSVPQPVLSEILYGLERLPPSKRRSRLEARYALLVGALRRSVWDDEVSRAFGRLKALLERRGARLEDFDVAIAAHALATGATLVTADAGHARIPGLTRVNWLVPPSD